MRLLFPLIAEKVD